ncbi:UDP-2-acetamido-2,6-beta-L-arabino-hexul-4-ose reductase [bioreactor metagenome]|jgi:UDP-2-acetamido-2,6-beta-L-arabino-hexul-4-ose reductase|uniref:UDP-2-acetamido-2,6-beta-L-arabino-hexul-4-ose reductase n=1 Tax=bioreactor metagenome TaxID=1076179 RepID=A0A644TUW6_9ZZZZ
MKTEMLNGKTILITGSGGFIGKNLIWELRSKGYEDLRLFDLDTDPGLLDAYTKDCDFVFHLAGVNRPEKQEEFMKGNFGFTDILLASLKKNKNTCPILITSSIQAALDNPYGRSKKAGEELLFSHARQTGSTVYVFRLPNVFGKWCRPNYNSAVATFCHNIARDLPIQVNDPGAILSLVYIDDVLDAFLGALQGDVLKEDGFCRVSTVYTVKLGRIVELLREFKESRTNLSVPNMAKGFEKVLYSTYLSYLPENQFSYPLKMNTDNRGSFTEIIRTAERGQFSVNVSKPGITKGNHWHHTKNEKFLVVSGKALIRFRRIGTGEVIDYHMSGEKLEVVDIPPGYTHTIINEGEGDLVTFMWANEQYDPDRPDTIFEKV